jgi:hypothetical protein
MELDKYSKKIHNFLDKYEILRDINFTTESKTIDKFQSEIKESKPYVLRLTENYKIDKINVGKYPIIYEVMKDKHKSFKKFIRWYRENQKSISQETRNKLLKDISIKNKYLYELLYGNPFISMDVQFLIETSTLNYEHYESESLDLRLFTIVDSCIININLISRIVNFMKTISNYKSKINLILFIGNQKKFLTYENYICEDNTNSGCSQRDKNIMIWRIEELYKVLIHELIHYTGIDFAEKYDEMKKIFDDNFNIHGSDNVYESYVETLAVILNSIMVSELLNISFDKIITYEIKFSLYQVAKICVFFGIKDFEDLFNKNIKSKFNQSTSVCSYYIIKILLLLNLNKFLDIWNDEKEFVKLYSEVITNHYKCSEIINKLIKSHKTDDSFISRTMRMVGTNLC